MKSGMPLGFYGDGFVEGVGDDGRLGFVGSLAKAANLPFVNLGRDGATSTDVLKSWHETSTQHDFSGIIISFGAEDCLFGDHKRPQVGQLDRLKNTKVLMMAARVKAPTLFISPFPVVGRENATPCIANTARQMTTIARVNKVDYINIFDGVLSSDIWRGEAEQGDGKYPKNVGYQAAAELVMQDAAWKAWLAKVRA